MEWRARLFPQQDTLLPHAIRVGSLCGEEPRQLISGQIDRPSMHLQASLREGRGRSSIPF